MNVFNFRKSNMFIPYHIWDILTKTVFNSSFTWKIITLCFITECVFNFFLYHNEVKFISLQGKCKTCAYFSGALHSVSVITI